MPRLRSAERNLKPENSGQNATSQFSRLPLNDASLPGRPDNLFRIATEPTELQARAFGLLGVDPDAYISVTG